MLQPARTLFGRMAPLRLLAAIAIGTMTFGADALLLLLAAEALPRLPLLVRPTGVVIPMLPRLPALRFLASLDKLAL